MLRPPSQCHPALQERQVLLAQALPESTASLAGIPLRSGASSASASSDVTCRVAPLLPGRPVVTVAGGAGLAFSKLGRSVQDITEFYQWAMDVQVWGWEGGAGRAEGKKEGMEGGAVRAGVCGGG